MKVRYEPEVGDLVVVTMAGGATRYAKVANVAEDLSIYCYTTDGKMDFVADRYHWSEMERVWIIAGKDVTF